MNETNGIRDNNEAREPAEAMLRRYLLGRLPEDERGLYEARLFTDETFAERVRRAELELADDCAGGRLSETEQALFARNFLVTAERRRLLAVSQALHAHARARHETVVSPGWRDKLRGWFTWSQPVPAFGVVLAALVLLIGALWLWLHRPDTPVEPRVARQEPTPNLAFTPQPTLTATPTPPARPVATPTPFPKPPPATPAPPARLPERRPVTIASLVLSPGALRDGGEMARVTRPKGENDLLRLQLTLEATEPGLYQAQLLTAEGRPVTARRCKSAGAEVVLDVPARLLRTGDYQVRLSRQTAGQTESAGRYYFRVLP